jgi:S1-C subfamily serine protease
MADHFLVKSTARAEDCLSVNGEPVLGAHAALRDLLTARLGPEAANLFAEPFISRDKSGGAMTIAWHSVHAGDERPLSELDPVARRPVEDRLHRLIPRIEALAADAALAPQIRAALSLAGPQDIRVVGGHPVLINWGLRSQAEAPALAAFMRGDAEPVAAAFAPAVAPVAAAAAGGAALAATAASAAPPPPPPLSPPAPPPARGLPAVAWVPLVVLLGVAALTLLWLLWPGTRVFPPRMVETEKAVGGAMEAEIAALRDRRDSLRAALEGAQCRADGALVLPGRLTPEGLSVPDAGAPPMDGPITPRAPVAPAPGRVTVPTTPGTPGDTGSLLELLEQRTVLVLAQGGQSISTGSGFFVGPGLIVTNQHVIEGVQAGGLFVTNAALGRAEPAEVLKVLGPLEQTGGDFALLRIAKTDIPAFALAAPTASMKLHHVVTAGFPGDVMETDTAYQALMRGDASAIPDLVVVDGTVNAEQPIMSGTETLIHSAPLAKGNSGGPLVDFCGRVVGVNTFVRAGPLRNLNFALGTVALVRFLEGTPAAVTAERESCQPNLAPARAAPAPAAD